MTIQDRYDKLFPSPSLPAGIDPFSIPCIETSAPEALVKNPLVSVRVITYNHEPYLRQCFDSVLMQKTDFTFEVVIGEDCSTDKTREICFDYQRKFPEKVRVLWAHENVYEKGGNQRRAECRCRGEYIAYLEGDDYWTDPLKLQKQIDLIRSKGAIGCVANYQTRSLDGALRTTKYRSQTGNLTHDDLCRFYPHTSTYVISRDFVINRSKIFPYIHCWYDVILMHCLVETGKVVFLSDNVSVYRITGKGIATGLSRPQKQLLAVRQYLDLYLNGPRFWHNRFGSAVMTYIAFFFNRSTPGWSRELIREKGDLLKGIFWRIFLHQFYDLRSIRAFLRYVRFRLGFVR